MQKSYEVGQVVNIGIYIGFHNQEFRKTTAEIEKNRWSDHNDPHRNDSWLSQNVWICGRSVETGKIIY